MMKELATQQAELEQTNSELVKQKMQLSEQAAELRARNEQINFVSQQRKEAEEADPTIECRARAPGSRPHCRSATIQRGVRAVRVHCLARLARAAANGRQLLPAYCRPVQRQTGCDADDFIDFIVDGAQRMQMFIEHLLAYSRLGRERPPFALVDVNVVLKRSLRNLQQTIEESDADVTSAPLPTVLADEVQLVQLFQNLIGNAVKFRGPRRPRVQIGVQPDGPNWTFSVRDNGIGIDSKFAARVFVIFQRLHTTEEYAGTGIGLAFCKKIVERHGGRIWMESELGQGATFCFTLPRSGEK